MLEQFVWIRAQFRKFIFLKRVSNFPWHVS